MLKSKFFHKNATPDYRDSINVSLPVKPTTEPIKSHNVIDDDDSMFGEFDEFAEFDLEESRPTVLTNTFGQIVSFNPGLKTKKIGKSSFNPGLKFRALHDAKYIDC